MNWIDKLKNKHLGKEIFIAGAGPSLDGYPDDFLENRLAITLHNAYLKFPNTQYRHANEMDRVQWFKKNKPEYLDKVNIFAWPFYGRTKRETEETIDPDRNNYYFFALRDNYPEERIPFKVKEAKEGTAIDFGGYGTCLHACLFVAIYMGCSLINIIGCEHRVKKGRPQYFGLGEKAAEGLHDRNYLTLGKIQTRGTKLIIDACKNQGIVINWI